VGNIFLCFRNVLGVDKRRLTESECVIRETTTPGRSVMETSGIGGGKELGGNGKARMSELGKKKQLAVGGAKVNEKGKGAAKMPNLIEGG
jgi:hypothetical protein